MKSTVSGKGQVTIPKRLRDRLGIRPGEILYFEEEEGRLVAVKQAQRDPVEAVYGILQRRVPTDDLMTQIRGEG